jgi:hypothetical protein
MATQFVAVTQVKHDGEVVAEPGDSVSGLDKELQKHLWVNGALAVKDSPEDPNTWRSERESFPTTPRVVEDSLRAQAANELFGHEDTDALTQPHRDAPKDPQGLADGTAKPGRPEDPRKTLPEKDQKPANQQVQA